jgi:hypothetical protein
MDLAKWIMNTVGLAKDRKAEILKCKEIGEVPKSMGKYLNSRFYSN